MVRPLRWSRSDSDSLVATPVDTGPVQSWEPSPPRQTSATPVRLREDDVPSFSVAAAPFSRSRVGTVLWPAGFSAEPVLPPTR